MITASAVVAACFLQLDRPGLLLTALIGNASSPAPWRFWTVVLLMLAYQSWRLFTDETTKTRVVSTTKFYSEHLAGSVKRKLEGVAAMKLNDSSNSDRYVPHHVFTKLRDIDTNGMAVRLVEQDEIGQPLSVTELMFKAKTLLFVIESPQKGRLVYIDDYRIDAASQRYSLVAFKLRSLSSSVFQHANTQDLIVPAALSLGAGICCVWRIFTSLRPVLIWA